MAKPPVMFDAILNADVLRLKSLRNTPGKKEEYWALFEQIKQKHKICTNTVYAELRKEIPGAYKGRYNHSLSMPVTPKEQRMVEELLSRKMIMPEIRRYMSSHLGIPYGQKRLMKVRKMIAANPSPTGTPSVFSENIRSLFYDFSKLDLSDPSAVHELIFAGDKGNKGRGKKRKYKANAGVIRDSLDLIIFSASSGGKNMQEIHRIKMELMLARRLHMVEQGLTIPTSEMRTIEAVRKSLQSSPGGMGAEGFTPDFRVLYETVKKFAPDAGIPYILRAAKDIQEKIGGSTMDIKSYWKELMESVHKETEENM